MTRSSTQNSDAESKSLATVAKPPVKNNHQNSDDDYQNSEDDDEEDDDEEDDDEEDNVWETADPELGFLDCALLEEKKQSTSGQSKDLVKL